MGLMKKFLVLLALVSALSLQPVRAATTITTTNHYACGANVGWMEGRGDIANGAVIGEYVCSGYLYAANVGWICLGGNAPANGIQFWLYGGIRLRGNLRLNEEMLFIEEERVRHLELKVDGVAFVYREMESCVRLD